MRFDELPEKGRIQAVKDALIRIIEKLSSMKPEERSASIHQHLQLKKPEMVVAVPEIAPSTISTIDLDAMKERNVNLLQKVKTENERLEAEYQAKLIHIQKLEAVIAGLKKVVGCVCGNCFNVNVLNGALMPELEILLPIARATAEEKSY